MSGGDLSNQRETHTAALTFGRKERHEYLLALIRRDARTVVRHCDGHATVRVTLGAENDPAVRRVAQSLDRVSDEINEGLIEQFDVSGDFERFRRNARRQMNVAGREVVGK